MYSNYLPYGIDKYDSKREITYKYVYVLVYVLLDINTEICICIQLFDPVPEIFPSIFCNT